MKTIFEHRSIRKYKSTPVKDDVLNTILEAGIRASNTGNMQVYSIVVTKDDALRKRLWEAHFKQEMVLQAPVHLTFCADINRFHKWSAQRNAPASYDNFLWFVNAAIDTVLASQNVALEAEHNGLGICYLGTATYMADKLIDILKLPKGVVPVAALAMGYPDENPPLTERLPLEGVVHHETYSDYSAEDIDRIHAEMEALESTAQFLKENNKETLPQIFTDVRYKKGDNVFFSKKYLDILSKQGFLNHTD